MANPGQLYLFPSLKLCAKCKLEKSFQDFYADRSRKDGLCRICKTCDIAYQQTRYKTHRRKGVKTKRFSKYNLTLNQYNSLFTLQNGSCAVCKIHQSKLRRALSIDHDHATNKVRGLLCHNCNTALGLLKDSPKFCDNLVEYIKKFKVSDG